MEIPDVNKEINKFKKLWHYTCAHPWLTIIFFLVLVGVWIGIGYFQAYVSEKGRQQAEKTTVVAKKDSDQIAISVKTRLMGLPDAFYFLMNSKVNKINLAVFVELISRSNQPTKIKTYTGEMLVGTEWFKLAPIPFSEPQTFLFPTTNGAQVREISLVDGLLNVKAKNNILKSGDFVNGWIFFKYPKELAENPLKLKDRRTLRTSFQFLDGSWQTLQTSLMESETSESDQTYLEGVALRIVQTNVDISQYELED